MIIEITGIPGSGKTTLAKAIRQLLKDRDETFLDPATVAKARSGGDAVPRFVKRHGERELLYRFYGFTSAHPVFCRKIEDGFKSGSIKGFFFYLMSAQFQYAKDLGAVDEMIFVDEGFINHSVAMCTTRAKQGQLLDIVDSMPLLDAVVFLNTPADLAFERLVARRGGNDYALQRTIEKFGDLDAFAEWQNNMEAAVNAYKTKCPTVIEIDALKPPQECVPQLVDQLIAVRDKLRS